ncbi:MAG: MBOAT family protein [Flavobacteriaceae bacterium]|nr:MBOAT family protein [Flavobacteriaceae bacterium]
MLFNSIDFAFFFPLVFFLYWAVAKKLTLRNALILIASYVFYGMWDWRFLFLIIISSGVDYFVGKQLAATERKSKRIWLLMTSLTVNLGFLLYFKYANFFIESFVDSFRLFGSEIEASTLHIILPVGISFYTFQTLSYTIDIFRRKIKPTHDALSFFAFVAFFPQLVAGPIERASHLLPQFHKTYKFNYTQVKSGLLLMAFGLFKKMVIADRAAIYVNEVYGNAGDYDGVAYSIATVLFAFQIYCDFSGYSDIAIGAARTMGFSLMKNFNSPYFAISLTEFWHRWHISLSTWFRDYVYIPLGGSKQGNLRTYSNLFIVFVISGLWHGAAWTFVIWGALHGAGLIIEKLLKDPRLDFMSKLGIRTPTFSNNLFFGSITFIFVCLAWIFFRASSFENALAMLAGIFNNFKFSSLFSEATYNIGFTPAVFRALVIMIVLLLLAEIYHSKRSLFRRLNEQGLIMRWSFYFIIVFVLIIFGVYSDEGAQEFIYFQF